MLTDFLKPENIKGAFLEIQNALSSDGAQKPRVSVFKLTEGAKHHIVSYLKNTRLLVVPDKLAARNTVEKLNAVREGSAVYIAERDDTLLNVKNVSQQSLYERINALSALVERSADTAVVTAEGLLNKYPSPKLFLELCVRLEKDMSIAPQTLSDMLARSGYRRVEAIFERGEFSLRGDILDVFPFNREFPCRVDFFDDFIESVKEFELETMKPRAELETLFIAPASDILADKKSVEELSDRAHELTGKAKSVLLELKEKAVAGACPPELVWLRPFLPAAQSSVLEYFLDGVVAFDEPKIVYEKLALYEKEHQSRVKSLLLSDEISARHADAVFTAAQITEKLKNFKLLSLSSLALSNPLFEPTAVFSPVTRPVTKYYLDPAALVSDIKTYLINSFKVVLCARSQDGVDAVFSSLRSADAPVTKEGLPAFGKALITPLKIENGFVYPEQKLVVIGAGELVGKKREFSRILQKKQFIEPNVGDYVVHSVHGVGICEGTTRMKIGGYEKEFVVIRYLDNDLLYVTVDQMDNLHKFIGEANPPLNKLGGKDFLREKQKVKKSVKKLAVDLLSLYDKRNRLRGYVYPPDTEWQAQFEDDFPYDETEDQLSAIKTVKEEMESGKVVDRLICGDVGFGKTEVAFRAMFKTILENRQALLLAPTTILCKQHHELLSKRLEPFGIECGILSRMQTAAQNAETLKRLKDGTLSVAVATHRLLSRDVKLHNPGLLVLDEEQRFGVEHKERIKEKHPDINVLTLSATPIPRTLNMALSGIRDISLLETPPKGRLPIQTYVVEYSDALIYDAITREAARGGQTLVLYNSVEHMAGFTAHLESRLPQKIKVIRAHGQMPAATLEKNITAFYDKQYDVLVATTIIENGIDLPDANTLIVIDADNFGLSQLYQLRGRVGRRGTLAHAYFTLPPSTQMNPVAEKRLTALLENTEIGIGFKISVADLSIRGAGALLGAEQHGHIERVGYQMYIELLNRAVEELRTGKSSDEREIEFKVEASAYIRENYVSARDKLRIYRRISEVSTLPERDNLLKELSEVYGEADAPLKNLVGISLIKNLARGLDVKSVVVNKKGVGVNFNSDRVFQSKELLGAVAAHPKDVVLTSTIPPSLVFRATGLSPEDKIELLVRFFAEVHG